MKLDNCLHQHINSSTFCCTTSPSHGQLLYCKGELELSRVLRIKGQQYQKQKRKKNRRNARVVLNQKQTRSSSQHSRGDYHVGERGEGARMLQDQLPNDPLRWAAAEITHLGCCNGCHLVRRKVATWAATEVTCAATEDACALAGCLGGHSPERPRKSPT